MSLYCLLGTHLVRLRQGKSDAPTFKLSCFHFLFRVVRSGSFHVASHASFVDKPKHFHVLVAAFGTTLSQQHDGIDPFSDSIHKFHHPLENGFVDVYALGVFLLASMSLLALTNPSTSISIVSLACL